MVSAPQFDFERILNDFVLLTCLAGNDFLPNIPSLDIYDRPSALDTLMVRRFRLQERLQGRDPAPDPDPDPNPDPDIMTLTLTETSDLHIGSAAATENLQAAAVGVGRPPHERRCDRPRPTAHAAGHSRGARGGDLRPAPGGLACLSPHCEPVASHPDLN